MKLWVSQVLVYTKGFNQLNTLLPGPNLGLPVDNFAHNGRNDLRELLEGLVGVDSVLDVQGNHLCFSQNWQRHARDLDPRQIGRLSKGRGDLAGELLTAP